MLQLWGQEVLLSRNPSGSCGYLGHTGLSACEQWEGKSWTERNRVISLFYFCREAKLLVICVLLLFFYLQPSHKHRQQCPLPCHRAAVGRPPHIAPCTHLSAAEFDSHTLSTSLPPAPSQKRPRTELQNHTGSKFESEQRQNNIVRLNIKMLLHWHYRKIKVQT